MIYGNILGSNLFNIAILALDDVAYTKGPLLPPWRRPPRSWSCSLSFSVSRLRVALSQLIITATSMNIPARIEDH